MERIEENAKIVVLLLEQLINKESNIEISRSLNDLKIYHVAILNSLFINYSNNITTILAFSSIRSIYINYKNFKNNVKNK